MSPAKISKAVNIYQKSQKNLILIDKTNQKEKPLSRLRPEKENFNIKRSHI